MDLLTQLPSDKTDPKLWRELVRVRSSVHKHDCVDQALRDYDRHLAEGEPPNVAAGLALDCDCASRVP